MFASQKWRLERSEHFETQRSLDTQSVRRRNTISHPGVDTGAPGSTSQGHVGNIMTS